MADLPKEPVTRQEMYLSRLAGENTTLPIEPVTREEMYLEGAIDRVEAVEQEVEEMKDNPDVVDIVDTYADLQAYDTTHLSDNDIIRVLADETHSGNSTYYKFNKQVGTWTFIGEIAGGGGIKELTSADYNWPVSDPEGVAYWLLSDGVYKTTSGVRFYYNNLTSSWDAVERVFIVETDTSPYKVATSIQPNTIKYYKNNSTDGSSVSGYPYVVLTSHDIVNTTGTNQSSVMSQNAVTSMVFADPANKYSVQIGSQTAGNSPNHSVAIGNSTRVSTESVVIGENALTNGANQIAIGRGAGVYNANARGCIALGDQTTIDGSEHGVMSIAPSSTSYGYNSTNYRLLTGLYDPVNAHDAATKGYVDGLVGDVAAALNAINNGTGA